MDKGNKMNTYGENTLKKILIVDDNAEILEYLADSLNDAGYQAETAHDGVQAVLRVLDGGCHGVIMDIRMPNLDGINALKIIRKVAPILPVVMITGQADNGEILAAKKMGAYACLPKPIKLEQIFTILEEVIPQYALAEV